MSAIAAVLSGRDEPAATKELAAMCAAATHGRAEGYRLEAAPGISVAGCGGDLVAASVTEEEGTVVAADARLDNRAELAAALGLTEPPPSDASLLVAGYRRWGDGLTDRLVGDFAFVLWDGRAERLLCARDPLGMRTLHYARLGTTLLVASEAAQLLAHPAMPRRIDARAIADYLVAYFSDPARSFYEGAVALPPGHLLVSRGGADTVIRYWRPEEIELQPIGLEEATERFRELLWRAVEDRLAGSGPVCGLLVSGGLDSSALLAVADDLLARQGARKALAPFCLTVEGCDESDYWKPLAAHFGLEIEQLSGATYAALDKDLRFWAESPFVGWQPPFETAFERLRLRQGRVMLTGLGGDSVVAGSACVHADRLRRGDIGVWREMAEHAAVRGGSLAGVLRYWGIRPLMPRPLRSHLARLDGPRRVPDWIDPRWARKTGVDAACRARPAEARFRSRARRAIHGRIAGIVPEQLTVHWFRRLAARHGIRVRHPFLDRRLVELILATPPEFLFRAGRYKRLMRRALAGRLPERVRQRVGKTGYGPYADHSFRRWASWIRELLAAPLLADMGVLRMDRLRPELERYLSG